MSHSVDELWKSVVQLAQQLPALSRSSSCKELPYIHRYVHSINALNSQLDLLSSKKGLPRATWKPLIKELKVCSSVRGCTTSFDCSMPNMHSLCWMHCGRCFPCKLLKSTCNLTSADVGIHHHHEDHAGRHSHHPLHPCCVTCPCRCPHSLQRSVAACR